MRLWTRFYGILNIFHTPKKVFNMLDILDILYRFIFTVWYWFIVLIERDSWHGNCIIFSLLMESCVLRMVIRSIKRKCEIICSLCWVGRHSAIHAIGDWQEYVMSTSNEYDFLFQLFFCVITKRFKIVVLLQWPGICS